MVQTGSKPLLLARLRQLTESHHRQIESSLAFLQSDCTLNDYRLLLEVFFSYHSPWELVVCQSAPDLLAGRSKLGNLWNDLQWLGASPDEITSLEMCTTLPPLDTRPRILGSMYVLEGATLGGQLLQRYFVRQFDLSRGGCAFFRGYGQQTGAMWKQFGEMLAAVPDAHSDAAIESAIATFDSMRTWICKSKLVRCNALTRSAEVAARA